MHWEEDDDIKVTAVKPMYCSLSIFWWTDTGWKNNPLMVSHKAHPRILYTYIVLDVFYNVSAVKMGE